MSKYLVKKNSKGEWRWTFIARNGEKIAQASEGYKSKGACEKSIELLKASASAPVEYDEPKKAAAAKAEPKAKAAAKAVGKAVKAAAKAAKPAAAKKTPAKKLAKV